MTPRGQAVGPFRNSCQMNLSPCWRHTFTRWLLVEKLKHDVSENTTMYYSVVHIAQARHHCRHWHLYCGVIGSLLNGCHECRTLTTNRREMILVDMGTPKGAWTYYRMEVEEAFWFATACRWRVLTSHWHPSNLPLIFILTIFTTEVHSWRVQMCFSCNLSYGSSWPSEKNHYAPRKIACLLKVHPLTVA